MARNEARVERILDFVRVLFNDDLTDAEANDRVYEMGHRLADDINNLRYSVDELSVIRNKLFTEYVDSGLFESPRIKNLAERKGVQSEEAFEIGRGRSKKIS